jgi:hypothetical protein
MAIEYRDGGWGSKIFALVLLVIFAGMVYAFWDTIKERLGEEDAAAPAPAPARTRRPPTRRAVEPPRRTTERRAPDRKPVARPAPSVSLSESTVRRAEELRTQGEAALAKFDFKAAAELFGKQADLLARDPRAVKKARALHTKAVTLGTLLSEVKRNPETGGNLVVLRCYDGRNIEGALVGETDTAYVVAKRGNITGEVDKADVSEIIRVPRETQRERALQAFVKEEAKLRDSTAVSHYLLGERAYRDGLDRKAIEHLEKAYAKEGAGLPKALRKYEATQMLLRAMWCESTGRTSLAKMWCRRMKRTYSDQAELMAEADELLARMNTTKVASYKPTVKIKVSEVPDQASPRAPSVSRSPSPRRPKPKKEKVTGVEAEQVVSRSPHNTETVSRINKTFDRAMDHYVKGRPGEPNSNMHLSKAVALFDQVIALCDKALKNDPGNAQILSRQSDASRFGYHARKMKTLGFGP